MDLARNLHAHIADLAVVRALVVVAIESILPEELSGVVAAAVLGIGQISLIIARISQVEHPASDRESEGKVNRRDVSHEDIRHQRSAIDRYIDSNPSAKQDAYHLVE